MAWLESIAQALGPLVPDTEPMPQARSLLPVRAMPAARSKPVLQLNAFPVSLRPQDYANPLSTLNPGGSLQALWALRQLVDPVPEFTRFYAASPTSTESAYRQIALGASAATADAFVQQTVHEAQRALGAAQGYANMDQSLGSWLPVQATPADWSTATDRYADLSIDLTQPDALNSAFTLLGGKATDLQWLTDGGAGNWSAQAGAASRPRAVHLKYLMISLARPWYNAMLFQTAGWGLSGQPPGFCSSGCVDSNNGVLPMVPTGLLLGTNVQIDGEWAAADRPLLAAARAGDA
ncbi:MAG: hypothetical protein Q8N44_19680, partial [Rubrivivax sp.]|nr:hypothetical protein [Rubrivivax sp.]